MAVVAAPSAEAEPAAGKKKKKEVAVAAAPSAKAGADSAAGAATPPAKAGADDAAGKAKTEKGIGKNKDKGVSGLSAKAKAKLKAKADGLRSFLKRPSEDTLPAIWAKTRNDTWTEAELKEQLATLPDEAQPPADARKLGQKNFSLSKEGHESKIEVLLTNKSFYITRVKELPEIMQSLCQVNKFNCVQLGWHGDPLRAWNPHLQIYAPKSVCSNIYIYIYIYHIKKQNGYITLLFYIYYYCILY